MDNRPVGIFDSGLGGLTAVKAFRELLPGEDIVYFADSARVPYGTRTPREIGIMARQNMDFLASYNVKAVLAACGTVSSNAAALLENYPLPAVGVIKAAVKAMAKVPGSAPFGVIATPASIKNGAYERELKALCPDREVISAPCPDFVTLIESGHIKSGDLLLSNAVERYMEPIKKAGAAAVLLGCTHFGIVSEALLKYLGEDTQLISASACAAEELKKQLAENFSENEKKSGGLLRCYTSGSPDEFYALASQFLGREPDIFPEHVPIAEV